MDVLISARSVIFSEPQPTAFHGAPHQEWCTVSPPGSQIYNMENLKDFGGTFQIGGFLKIMFKKETLSDEIHGI